MRLLLKNWVLNCKTGIMKKIIYILFGMLAWWSCEDENSLIGPESFRNILIQGMERSTVV